MKKLYYLLLAITLCLIACKEKTEQTVLRVNLEGLPYDSLSVVGLDVDDNKIIINGLKENTNNWLFEFSDTIAQRISTFNLYRQLYNTKDSTIIKTQFVYINNRDTLNAYFLNLDNVHTVLSANYLYSDTVKGEFPLKKDNEWSLVKGYVKTDYFAVTSVEENSDFMLQLKYPNFSMFRELDENEYQNHVKKTIDVVLQNSNSHYLMLSFYRYYRLYKSKEDVKNIFNCFSEQERNSYWGKSISRYLDLNHFENMELPVWNGNRKEYIVRKDINKYTLVVFTASWCKPCHEELPLLKKIHQDLSSHLEIVSIALEDTTTVSNWVNLMKKEGIPWRSLLAIDLTKDLNEKYSFKGVPYVLLVTPNGYMETVDVRDEKQRQKLYRLNL